MASGNRPSLNTGGVIMAGPNMMSKNGNKGCPVILPSQVQTNIEHHHQPEIMPSSGNPKRLLYANKSAGNYATT